MAITVRDYAKLIPELERAPQGRMWVSYDREADVIYINFRMPAVADGGDEIQPDVIARYDEAGELIGYTILNASRKLSDVNDA
jgi:uncharacterized protein YuzE